MIQKFSKFRLRIWFENIDVKMETLELKIAKSLNAAKKIMKENI